MEFEWDAKKEKLNLIKHGVGFLEAQRAFLDPLRVIAVDEAHSKREQRLFCIGAQRPRNSYRAFHSARRLSSNHRGRILAQRQGTL